MQVLRDLSHHPEHPTACIASIHQPKSVDRSLHGGKSLINFLLARSYTCSSTMSSCSHVAERSITEQGGSCLQNILLREDTLPNLATTSQITSWTSPLNPQTTSSRTARRFLCRCHGAGHRGCQAGVRMTIPPRRRRLTLLRKTGRSQNQVFLRRTDQH